MASLQENCYQTIAQQMSSFPPFLQETIMGETRARVERGMRAEVESKVEKELEDQLQNVLVFLVPEIMKDILVCRRQPHQPRTDFYSMYKSINPSIVRNAINIAEATSACLDNFYVDEFMNIAEEHIDWDTHQYSEDESSDVDYPDSDELVEGWG